MQTEPNRPGDTETPRPGDPFFYRWWTLGVDGLAALGTLMIVVLMVMICSDVVARNLLGASLPLVSELGALTLVMIVYLQLGTTIRERRLACTDFFLTALGDRRPRAAAFVGGLWDIAGIAACAAIAWSTWGILGRDLLHREFIGVTGIMTMPTWPFRALILLGLCVATIQFTVQAVRAFRTAFGPENPA